jgi:hypothetical protein
MWMPGAAASRARATAREAAECSGGTSGAERPLQCEPTGGIVSESLTHAEVDGFVRDGFVRIEDAFSPETAAACRALVWPYLSADPADPGSWRRPVVHVVPPDAPPLRDAANGPKLLAAFDQLVGPGRWDVRPNAGLFVVRFPTGSDPGDAGWHIDGSFPVRGRLHVNLASTNRALLLLMLFSDVGPDDAPTRIRVGSHLDVAPVLAPAGDEGMPFDAVVPRLPATTHARPIAHATGRAGTVFVCHPFLVHAASWPHRGAGPRFIAQPPLHHQDRLESERADAAYSPVERAIRVGLGLEPAKVAAAAPSP